ncbi:MAG: DUF4384 domain-containing protein [Spirochaetales bacterium]|nr:DUF4384 domain-containing protein [Spirochaetales bacterium]
MQCYRKKKLLPFVSGIILLIIILPLCISSEEKSISFTWAFFCKIPDGTIHTTDYTKNTIFLSGDYELKIFLRHEKDTFLYLFLHDAEGDLYLFYPAFFSDFEVITKPEQSIYIPEDLEWFSLEGKGKERFYLLASAERLARLENYTEAYQKVFYSSTSSKEDLNELRQKVIDEIRRLRIEHFALIKKAQDAVLLVAGEFRGLDKTLEFPAQQITVQGFYARTIRIEH